jgi:hypothetical protein
MRELKKHLVQVSPDSKYFDTEYPNQFPVGNYFADKFGVLPSYIDTGNVWYEKSVVSYFSKDKKYKYIWNCLRQSDKGLIKLTEIFESDNGLVILSYKSKGGIKSLPEVFYEEEYSDPDYVAVSFYYIDEDIVKRTIKDILKYKLDRNNKSRISLVTTTSRGLTTVEQTIKPVEVDIPLNYGEAFVSVHNKIVDRLNEDNGKGLVLLHGVPGTGKTNYIRHLCGKLQKEIIFIPPFMAESIAGPDFITFLLEHTNSVLVIEDAEKVVLDRDSDSGSRQSVSNLLNMTDGLLSDCLSIQIIATFNTSRDRIDKALLRKGRLIAEWKFDALNVEDTNKLLESIGREERSDKPLTLTEIYNMDEVVNVVQEERRAIGFGR